MIALTIDGELERRLRQVAAQLKKSPEECALSAVRTFVADAEEAAAHAARFGGDGVVRPPDEYWD
ncbi:MAG: hypothetical protein ACM33T_12480 [Solirubrobacterales bacterium]